MEKKPRTKIVTVYGKKRVGSEKKWEEEERQDAIAYFKNIINTTTGAEREGALNVYVALLEGVTVCEDTFPYSQLDLYSVKMKNDPHYFLGLIEGETLVGEREARVIYTCKADAEHVAEGMRYVSCGDEYEIEKEHGETRVPNYEKLLADVGLSVKTAYAAIDR